jgi:sporulation integral membrane protein YtvI
MPENNRLRRLWTLFYLALAVLGVWLFVRFALGWLLPFIAAFLLSRMIEPLVRLLTARLRFKRVLASALCVVLVFAAVVSLLSLAVGRAVYELAVLAKDIPALLQDLTALFTAVGAKLRGYVLTAPPELQAYLNDALGGVSAKSADMLSSLSRGILSFLSGTAAGTPRFFVFLFTCAVSTFFISSGYAQITAFILRQIPEARHRALREFKRDLLSSFGKWLRAQLMLSGVTFLELCVLFLALRIDFAILLALIVAFIDMLPVLGVGTILAPWGAIALLGGDTGQGILLLSGFVVILLVRNVLEPKFVGGQLGLAPIAALMAMYIGFCVAGILGMALFPLGLIMIKHLNDRGYLRLWK